MSMQDAFMKHVGPGGLSGCTFSDWIKILYVNRFRVDAKYWPRAAFITFNSMQNSIWKFWEDFWYSRKVEETDVPPPIFIIGIWRSGTTHLHNLFSKDDRFAYANTYQTIFPHIFLSTEKMNSRMMQSLMPATRPMDNVKSGVVEPQEDEMALAACGLSFAVEFAFPRTGSHYHRFLTLQDANQAEISSWKSTFMWFLRKLTFKHGRPLVLKSTGHISRIKFLLELFPDAKFVHIHRNPFAVFLSSLHAGTRVIPYWTLQKSEPSIDRIISDYAEAYDAFLDQRHLIPDDNLCEVAFSDLESDPVAEMRRIYDSLQLPSFEYVEPTLRDYLLSIDGYQRNRFPELSEEMRERIAREWSRSFQELGYQKD